MHHRKTDFNKAVDVNIDTEKKGKISVALNRKHEFDFLLNENFRIFSLFLENTKGTL